MLGLGLQARQAVAAPEDLGSLALVIHGRFTKEPTPLGPDGHGPVYVHRWPGWLSVLKIYRQVPPTGNERHWYLRKSSTERGTAEWTLSTWL